MEWLAPVKRVRRWELLVRSDRLFDSGGTAPTDQLNWIVKDFGIYLLLHPLDSKLLHNKGEESEVSLEIVE